MSPNARRLPTLDAEGGQCPRARAAQATNREGRRAAAASADAEGLCDRPERSGGRRSEHELRAAKSRSAAEGLLCDRRRSEHRPGPGGPTCGEEQGVTWVLSPKRDLWAARAQGPTRRAVR